MLETRRRVLAALAAVSVVVALAGCAPSARAASPPKVSDLIVSPDGIAELQVGLPVTSYQLVTYAERACPTTGGWLPRYSQDLDNTAGQLVDPFDVVTRSGSQSGQIIAEYVWSSRVRTARGIGVGSSLAAVRAAYPHATRKTSLSTVMYIVSGMRGRLVIEVADGADNPLAAGLWPQGQLGTVLWMEVIPLHGKVASLANLGNAGPCPTTGQSLRLGSD